MKLILALTAITTVVYGAPPTSDKNVVVLRYENDNSGTNYVYSFNYKLSDNQTRIEVAEDYGRGLVVHGGYAWIAPDGSPHVIDFSADKNGFHPTFPPKNHPLRYPK